MKNIDLNPGGIIGALGCGALSAAVVFSLVDTTQSGRGPYRLVIVALIGGAFLGNFLWSRIFPK